jgi:hypothetical protein
MNRLAKFAIAAIAAGVPVTASAQVEYSLNRDPAFPSVLYVEFDPSTLPQIYTAPEDGNGGLPVIRGGSTSGDMSAPASQPARDSGQTSSTNGSGGTTQSLDERAENRVKQLLDSSPQEIEDMIVDRKIEDQAIKDLGIDIDG